MRKYKFSDFRTCTERAEKKTKKREILIETARLGSGCVLAFKNFLQLFASVRNG
jgi:hypothetical protein